MYRERSAETQIPFGLASAGGASRQCFRPASGPFPALRFVAPRLRFVRGGCRFVRSEDRGLALIGHTTPALRI
jgi:hypothetical protein